MSWLHESGSDAAVMSVEGEGVRKEVGACSQGCVCDLAGTLLCQPPFPYLWPTLLSWKRCHLVLSKYLQRWVLNFIGFYSFDKLSLHFRSHTEVLLLCNTTQSIVLWQSNIHSNLFLPVSCFCARNPICVHTSKSMNSIAEEWNVKITFFFFFLGIWIETWL